MSNDNAPGGFAARLYPDAAGDPDRLYRLLPADLRRRDQEGGRALQALLRVVGIQYDALEADVVRLYDDLFVETCRPPLLPYLGDLLGFRLSRTAAGVESGGAADVARAARQASLLRRLLGGLVASRRRKGTAAEARRLAVEFGHGAAAVVETLLRIDRTPTLRRPSGLGPLPGELGPAVRGGGDPGPIGGPAERSSRAAEVRRVRSVAGITPGRAHPEGVEVHVGRLTAYPIDGAPAYCVETSDDPRLFQGMFHPLGADQPLLSRPRAGSGAASATTFVAPITRRDLASQLRDEYGPGKSLAVWIDGRPVPAGEILVADLADEPARGGRSTRWALPEDLIATGRVLLDPERGRLAVRLPYPGAGLTSRPAPQPAPAPPPAKGARPAQRAKHPAPAPRPTPDVERPRVAVLYHFGLIGNLGGGGYPRRLRDVPPEWLIMVDSEAPESPPPEPADAATRTESPRVRTLRAALDLFADRTHYPPGSRVVIEIADNGTYAETLEDVVIPAGSRLTIRAASGKWPVVWVRDVHTALPDRLMFVGEGPGARLVLDGLRVAGRAVHLEDDLRATIRDTTLIPGWMPPGAADPDHPGAPSLTLHGVREGVVIERSILGRIQVLPKELSDPTPLVLRDSVLDAVEPEGFALVGAERHQLPPRWEAVAERPPHAYIALVLRRATVFGRIKAFAMPSASDSLMAGLVDIARRQVGCLRFCALPFESTTPRRYRCQPDLMRAEWRRRRLADAAERGPDDPPVPGPDDPASRAELDAWTRRHAPRFASRRYGDPTYAALAAGAPDETRRGAEDGGELGAFHDLDLPARDLELLDRLAESVPAGMDVRLVVHPGSVS